MIAKQKPFKRGINEFHFGSFFLFDHAFVYRSNHVYQ